MAVSLGEIMAATATRSIGWLFFCAIDWEAFVFFEKLTGLYSVSPLQAINRRQTSAILSREVSHLDEYKNRSLFADLISIQDHQ